MRVSPFIISLLAALVCGVAPARAENRMALVIGNSAYQNVPTLTNPVNDATDIAASLKRLDFEVRILIDARFDEIRRALISFGQLARGAEFAVIYFAGHGMEVGGENWLIPIDAQLANDLDVPNETIGLQSLMRAVSNASRLGLVVLDACRSNPFLPKMQQTNLTRAVARGFTRVEPNDNVLVAYSARDGTTAIDGAGRNSPFTGSLLKNIETPGLDVRFLFAGVRDEVMAATNRQQQPFIYGSLSRETISLKPPVAGVVAAAPPATPSPTQDVSVSQPVKEQPAEGPTPAVPAAKEQQEAALHPVITELVPSSGSRFVKIEGTALFDSTDAISTPAKPNQRKHWTGEDNNARVVEFRGKRIFVRALAEHLDWASVGADEFSLECKEIGYGEKAVKTPQADVRAKCSYSTSGSTYRISHLVKGVVKQTGDETWIDMNVGYAFSFTMDGDSCSLTAYRTKSTSDSYATDRRFHVIQNKQITMKSATCSIAPNL
jgi:hypothetical protein